MAIRAAWLALLARDGLQKLSRRGRLEGQPADLDQDVELQGEGQPGSLFHGVGLVGGPGNQLGDQPGGRVQQALGHLCDIDVLFEVRDLLALRHGLGSRAQVITGRQLVEHRREGLAVLADQRGDLFHPQPPDGDLGRPGG